MDRRRGVAGSVVIAHTGYLKVPYLSGRTWCHITVKLL